MVMTKFFLGAAALSAPLVAGHGYMGLPKVTFAQNSGDPTAFVATIESSQFTAPSGMSFTTDPTSNAKAFTAWIKTSTYTSLKDLITKKSTASVCGNTVLSDPQPLPDQVEWTHSSSEGFTPSHEGPCEVWCDDKMAFHDDDCAKNYPAAPAKLPYDKSKCTGASKLTTYWLALHSSTWQVYINCAALSGASSGGSASAGGSGSATKAPAATTATPTATKATPSATPAKSTATPAAAADSDDEDCDEDLPEPSGSEDCDEDLPEPTDGSDCDEDLPEPADGSDCDEDLPEPSDETAGDADITTAPSSGNSNSNKGESNANSGNSNSNSKTTAPKNEDGDYDDNSGPNQSTDNDSDSSTEPAGDDGNYDDNDTTNDDSNNNANSNSNANSNANSNSNNNAGASDDVAGDADEDCDEDLPEPSGSEDCDEDLPEPDCDDDLPEPSGSEDCDEDLPEPAGSEDCDEDLPEPSANTPTVTPASPEVREYTGSVNSGYSFDTLNEGAAYNPGTAETDDY